LKTPSKDLFELIKSLSRTEKAYFKKFGKLHVLGDENNYIKLFDAIEKQNNYDEDKLRSKFKGERMLLHFWSAKKYLYDLILKSMELYHQNAKSDLMSLSRQAEMLLEKNLFVQAKKIISKGIKLSKQYELDLMLADFLNLERRCAYLMSYKGVNEQLLNKNYNGVRMALMRHLNEVSYGHLSNVIFFKLNRRGLIREQGQGRYLEKIIDHSLLKSEDAANTFAAKVNFNTIKYIYHNVKSNFKEAHKYNERLTDLYEANPFQLEKNLLGYITILINSALVLTALGKYDDVDAVIKKIKKIEVKDKTIQNFVLLHTGLRKMESLYLSGKMEEAKPIVLSIYNQVRNSEIDFKNNAAHEITYYYTLGSFLFILKHYKESNAILNRIYNNPLADTRTDVQCIVRIILLLIYFEMNKLDLLMNTINSTYRFLSKKQKLFRLENVFISFFKKVLIQDNRGGSLKELFIELKNEVQKIYVDPYESTAERYFSFSLWIDGKIQKRPFAEMIKENRLAGK